MLFRLLFTLENAKIDDTNNDGASEENVYIACLETQDGELWRFILSKIHRHNSGLR
jgi:hypothetical protein